MANGKADLIPKGGRDLSRRTHSFDRKGAAREDFGHHPAYDAAATADAIARVRAFLAEHLR